MTLMVVRHVRTAISTRIGTTLEAESGVATLHAILLVFAVLVLGT